MDKWGKNLFHMTLQKMQKYAKICIKKITFNTRKYIGNSKLLLVIYKEELLHEICQNMPKYAVKKLH